MFKSTLVNAVGEAGTVAFVRVVISNTEEKALTPMMFIDAI